MEKWIKITDWPYYVSDMGNVKNMNDRLLKTPLNSQGRRTVVLYRKGECKTVHPYQLVAEAFIGKYPGKVVCHKNGDRTDDRLENLRYGTSKENTNDRIAHGTMQYGQDVHNSKLSNQDVIEIRKIHKFRCPINGTMALARRYSVAAATISAVLHGQNWSKVERTHNDK